MKRTWIAGAALALVLVVVLAAFVARRPSAERSEPVATPVLVAAVAAAEPAPPVATPAAAPPAPESYQGFLHGRITAKGGAVYEGRLRWGAGGEEAFWSDYFNGAKHGNPWAASVPPERLPTERHPLVILGVEIAERERPRNLGRLFMARFGEIARIATSGDDVQVTLKSGTVFHLNRLEASDFDDTVRIWDLRRGVVDLDSLRIRTIELLPTLPFADAPERLHGTVRTRQGDFTGFLQWDREKGVGTDTLEGRTAAGDVSLRFDSVRAIAKLSSDGSVVTLRDGREVALTGAGQPSGGSRGLYVDDPRYGRVLVSWGAFERVDFSPADAGPAYGDFAAGVPLRGTVTTRAGGRLAGRLVYDLDESETTETLDAPSQGVDYTLPFGRIAAIVPTGGDAGGEQRASVTLRSGEVLRLEPAGDLGEGNAGMLVFLDGQERPEYVPWSEIARIDLARPATADPPPAVR